ncbi:MAG: efflux RND transporter periplasmic adaptor subunit [Gammaproteobacteria bacterium]|nr:efflux RND transporter periplasmic adaptor subunit [Gammaproteobacteria bacterium]
MRKKTVFIGILLLLIAGYWFFFHSSTPKDLALVAVTKGSLTSHAEAVGYIKPLHSSIVKSQINGTVEAIYHSEGEYVNKNTPLLKVKPAPDPADYAATYQELADATLLEKNSELDLARYEKALKARLITPNFGEYLAVQKTHNSARIRRILASQKLALLDRGETKVGGKNIANIVLSPIDGYILSRNVDVGDPVISISSAQSATALLSMADMHDLMFQGLVDEMDVSKIKLGLPAEIKIGSVPDKIITGTVTRIALQSDKENTAQGVASSSATLSSNSPFNVGFKVEITALQFPKDLILRSGYSATATINLQHVDNVLLLPMRVIQFKNDKPYVLLPVKGKKDPKQQPVEIGLTDSINVEIKSGLKLGDQVIDKPDTTVTTEF